MKSRSTLAALCALRRLPAWHQRPGAGPRVTETADALPARDCELEAGTTRERASGAPALRSDEVVFGCGIGFNTQVNVSWARDTSEGESTSGYALLGKTTYVMPEAGRTGWAWPTVWPRPATAATACAGRKPWSAWWPRANWPAVG
jgi:hypothetical protein